MRTAPVSEAEKRRATAEFVGGLGEGLVRAAGQGADVILSCLGQAPLSCLVAEAVRRAGVRAVVQSGWAELAADGADLLTIGDVPHHWLFPRGAAVAHHMGAGTTAAGLRAGRPTVPVPVLADQPFWAARVHALGAGRVLRRVEGLV